jgi:hypothetical protein
MLKDKRRRRLLAAFGAVIVTAGAGTTGTAMASEFRADLTGGNELAPADPDGWGRAKINIADSTNTICVDLEVRSLSEVTAAHIHRGAAGVNGPPVVNLDRPDDGDEDDCDDIGDALADEIQANPAGFYVNIHTTEFPEGAIRGQLAPSAD